MDFDEQMKIYDNMDNQELANESLKSKFKIQGLEEVTEMTEESDLSDNSCDDSSSASSDCSNSETVDRVKMAEDMKEYEKMAAQFFSTASIPFKFDFEDFENCKLNGEIRKLISYMKLTLPITHVKGSTYFIGVKTFNLELKGAFIYVDSKERFPDFINSRQSLFKKQLCFYMLKSGWGIEKVVQSLIDSKKIDNVSEKDVKIFLSYANPNATMSQKIDLKLE